MSSGRNVLPEHDIEVDVEGDTSRRSSSESNRRRSAGAKEPGGGSSIGPDELAWLRLGLYRIASAVLLDARPLGSAPAIARHELLPAARELQGHCESGGSLINLPISHFVERLTAFLEDAGVDSVGEVPVVETLGNAGPADRSGNETLVNRPRTHPEILNECFWIAPDDDERGRLLRDLEATYRLAGMRVGDPSLAPDDLSVELEYMALLCGREAEHWAHLVQSASNSLTPASGAATSLRATLQREETFLQSHLANWLPQAASAAADLDLEPAVSAALDMTSHLVVHDLDLMRFFAECSIPLRGRDGG